MFRNSLNNLIFYFRIQIRELFSGCVAVGLSKNEHLNSSALVAVNRFCDERGLPSVLQNTKARESQRHDVLIAF